MFKRLFFLSVMMAAVGVPYVVSSSSDWWSSFNKQFLGTSQTKTGEVNSQQGAESADKLASSANTTANPFSPRQTVEGAAVQDLGEVLRFDGTPGWVMARWPRVTAGLAELDLQGYRVPLVTGTAQDDLAGSLTYYFDRNQRVARINFHGATGDPRKLIALVTSRYSFLQQQTGDPSLALYQVKWNGKALSELRIRTARVVRADQPNARFEIDLAMKRP